MKWIRTYPEIPDPWNTGRAYIIDTIPRVYMDRNYIPVLEGLDDDTVIIEWDIALSAEHRALFLSHIRADPGRVHVAPYRLYPVSTGLGKPVWAHRTADLAWISALTPWCELFGLGLAYLPLAVVRQFLASGARWADDYVLSAWHHQAVHQLVRVHWDVRPVHLHY